jgi:all-trans-8'-apo-beta-carotenal 15,15'-oxygenase
VRRPGTTAEAEGWLVGTTLDTNTKRTQLHLFDARNLADGPVAVATLPYALPLGLHGSFKPA